MTIQQAKSIIAYYNSTERLFKNRIKTREVFEAEKILQNNNIEPISIPPKQRKSRAKVSLSQIQEDIESKMGKGYVLILKQLRQNTSKQGYFLVEKSTGKRFFMGKVVFSIAKIWNKKQKIIINFFKNG